MSNQLKPCPFCGIKPKISNYYNEAFGRTYTFKDNHKEDCFLSDVKLGEEYSKKKLIEKWNRRWQPEFYIYSEG